MRRRECVYRLLFLVIKHYCVYSVYLHSYVWCELLCDYKCVLVGTRSEMIITSSQTVTKTGANSRSEVIVISSQTVTMTGPGANSTREMIITSSLTVTMTSLNDLEVSFIAIAAVVAVLLVASMIVIGVVMYRHKRFRNAHNSSGPRYVFLWLAV